MKLINLCVIPVLTYGCQTWTLTEELKQKLRVTQNNFERTILNVRRSQKISIHRIRKLTKSSDIVNNVMKIKWNFAGHVQRYTDGRWTKKIVNWVPHSSRRRGRPKRRWCDDFIEGCGVSWQRLAQNREKWQKQRGILFDDTVVYKGSK